MRKIVLLIPFMALLAALLTSPALALKTLTKDNFNEPDIKITPEKSYYLPGEEVQSSYVITPKNKGDMGLIGGDEAGNKRTYTFATSLENAEWRIKITYYLGVDDYTAKGDKINVDVGNVYLEEDKQGVRSIEINLTGRVPSVSGRLEEVDVINVTKIKEVEENVYDILLPVKIKVVNENVFTIDIQKVRDEATALKKDFESENISYNKTKFDDVFSLLDSAESLVSSKSYVEADEKIKKAKNLLDQLLSEADKLKAETLFSKIEPKIDKADLNLRIIEISLNNVKNSENYTKFLNSYVELKKKYGNLKDDFDNAKNLMDNGMYKNAYNVLANMTSDLNKLISDINSLNLSINAEINKKQSWFSLLRFNLQISPIYAGILIAVVGAAIVIIAILKMRGGRRKWDELR